MKDYLFRLNAQRTIHLLRRVVRNREAEYLPPLVGGIRPLYCITRAPSDLVGYVLFRGGLDLLHLDQLDALPGDTSIQSIWRRPDFPVGLSVAAAEILCAAQIVQDQGDTWGHALAAAEGSYRRQLATL